MAPTILFIVLSLLFTLTSTHIQSNEEGFISVQISNKGLDFAKDVLIDKAVSSIVPLQLPDIEKSVKIPVVGKVHILLSNITIYHVDVASSYIHTGETGIVLVASGATANLSMAWQYSYRTWLVPIAITDDGGASVQVEGMEVGLTAALKNQDGNLKLSVLECGCHVKDISIKLDGGASWLYQVVVNAFEGKISSAVEDAISKKIREGIIKLDSLLQSLPKEFPVYGTAVLNVTFVDNPVLSNSSIEFDINGLVTAKDAVLVSNYNHKGWEDTFFCSGPAKMIQISLQQDVFNSVSLVYFDADYMHWIVDKIPDQSLLNTAGWRYIVPQLYKQYPDDDMNLNISVSSPPIIKVAKDVIGAIINLDVTIDVVDAGEVIPVACISLVHLIETSVCRS
ncbi:putative BPI/LBP family protein At1g04970 isoform X3 [Alnus glutinosa]|uniref:putative BPI/LBP family protein At1g04970 isoform X3 n=1 Tax=Alnus glutinosa TaxID=3517 RepID=UPI002D766715|nr:putative BPI/LBP family protein At1g04970 isoform X3 [Alnus glutinosa]